MMRNFRHARSLDTPPLRHESCLAFSENCSEDEKVKRPNCQRMTNVSRSVAVACGVFGILILICGVIMAICGAVWMADFHKIPFTGKFSHIHSGHGLWSGALFIIGGAVGIVLFKQQTRTMLVVFLVMSCIVTLVGWIEVGLLGDFFAHFAGQWFDAYCLSHKVALACKFMATLRAVAAFSGVGACLAIGGIITASVGLCAEQNTGLQSQQQFQQPQGPVVVMQVGQQQQQPGQSIVAQQTQMPLQYHPGSYFVQQNAPGQVSGHYNIATAPADQKMPFPPAYTQ